MESNVDRAIVGRRLTAVRLALGYEKQVEMARAIGATQTQYNNWETGVGIIPVHFAARLRDISGVTLDYLYLGHAAGMPFELMKKLAAAKV